MSNKIKFIEPEMVRIIHQKPEKVMKITMVHLPKGDFMMGSNESKEEQPVHKVTINYEFEIGKYPVTIGEYMPFAEEHSEHLPEWLEKGSKYNIKTGTDDHYKNINQDNNAPIVGISWNNAVAFCKWLSQKSRKNFRLPTEAEWEYACRADTTTQWSFGDSEEELDEYAWYDKNSEGKTHPVGQKKPNPWGIYDMHGNVWEWCEDDYVDKYNNTPRNGTAYKSEKSSSKVVRGGSWVDSAYWSRAACRYGYSPGSRYDYRGFRLLRTLP